MEFMVTAKDSKSKSSLLFIHFKLFKSLMENLSTPYFSPQTMISFLLFSLFLFHTSTVSAAATLPYNATDYILLNCGLSSNSADDFDRSWEGDERSKYATQNNANISFASNAANQDTSVRPVPYMTARVFRSSFTYIFPLLSGPKFIRLYFYPSTFSGFNASKSFFSVTANEFTLLSNFSVFLNSNTSDPSFMKEFIINVNGNQRVNLTFLPNPNSFAFVNGIEIVPLPEELYFRGNNFPIKKINQLFYLANDTALENLYRLNVGGSYIRIVDDTGMFRAWNQDDPYIWGADYSYTPFVKDSIKIKYTTETPSHSAPEHVYTTSRVTGNTSISLEWGFLVDSGFDYLLRLHFCEIQLEVTKQNERVFRISIDNQTAEIQADVIAWTGGNDIPIFKDYVAWVPNDGRRGKKYLRLSLTPDSESLPKYESAVLNGLEIFKLSDSTRSLAAANPERSDDSPMPGPFPNPPKNKSKLSSVIYAVIGSVIGAIVVVSAVSFLTLRWRRRRVKDPANTSVPKSSWVPLSTGSRSTTKTIASGFSLPSDLCRHFLLDEIKSATNNFDDSFVIGKGGFGNVYKGNIDNGATTVAVKRLNPSSNQGAREFQTEIEMLSKLRHLHLVSLIGFCVENGEMILVYDYMAHGTLRDHLYNSENPPLQWRDRLKICIGAAKGLHYLHTGAKHTIIHRDVKSTNILLDEKWVAKVSDFGLSKVGPTGGGHAHVSTVVKGSFGYVDPEYYRRQQLTDKSDVYSFGVVLFEVLCARPAIIPTYPKEQVNLAEWAKSCFKKGYLEKIIDPNLEGKIAPECLNKYVETAFSCLRDKGIERPAMSDVVWSLEFAMQLQEAAENRGGDMSGGGGGGAFSPSYPLSFNGEPSTTEGEEMFSSFTPVSRSKSSLTTDSSDNLKPADVFSELVNPVGRLRKDSTRRRNAKMSGINHKGPPKHQNHFAWKPNSGRTINPTEVGGRFRPFSEVTGVCSRCKEQIEWKRKYGKYKPLTEPAKCQKCSKRNVRQAYHNLCTACAKEHGVCAKCSCRVDHVIGRDISEVEAEQKTLEEAIKNARERDRRTLMRTMKKGKSHGTGLKPTKDNSKAGELFTASSLDEYAEFSRDDVDDDSGGDEDESLVVS